VRKNERDLAERLKKVEKEKPAQRWGIVRVQGGLMGGK
jgi:hypothetical protein